VGLDEIQSKCDSPEKRRTFLEDMVIDSSRVPWSECELTLAFSLKDDDRDWCFGLFDGTLARLLKGDFVGGDAKALEFAQELMDALSTTSTEFDDVATSLLICNIRERAEDELYERGLETEGAFRFGDESVSPEADKKRREALFKSLCALRFVRLGLKS